MSPSKTISFRINGKLAGKLSRKALENRQSLHEYAREIFLDALSQQEIRDEVIELRDEMQNFSAELDDLHHALSIVLYKFLVELIDVDDEKAREWIALNLSSHNYQRDE